MSLNVNYKTVTARAPPCVAEVRRHNANHCPDLSGHRRGVAANGGAAGGGGAPLVPHSGVSSKSSNFTSGAAAAHHSSARSGGARGTSSTRRGKLTRALPPPDTSSAFVNIHAHNAGSAEANNVGGPCVAAPAPQSVVYAFPDRHASLFPARQNNFMPQHSSRGSLSPSSPVAGLAERPHFSIAVPARARGSTGGGGGSGPSPSVAAVGGAFSVAECGPRASAAPPVPVADFLGLLYGSAAAGGESAPSCPGARAQHVSGGGVAVAEVPGGGAGGCCGCLDAPPAATPLGLHHRSRQRLERSGGEEGAELPAVVAHPTASSSEASDSDRQCPPPGRSRGRQSQSQRAPTLTPPVASGAAPPPAHLPRRAGGKRSRQSTEPSPQRQRAPHTPPPPPPPPKRRSRQQSRTETEPKRRQRDEARVDPPPPPLLQQEERHQDINARKENAETLPSTTLAQPHALSAFERMETPEVAGAGGVGRLQPRAPYGGSSHTSSTLTSTAVTDHGTPHPPPPAAAAHGTFSAPSAALRDSTNTNTNSDLGAAAISLSRELFLAAQREQRQTEQAGPRRRSSSSSGSSSNGSSRLGAAAAPSPAAAAAVSSDGSPFVSGGAVNISVEEPVALRQRTSFSAATRPAAEGTGLEVSSDAPPPPSPLGVLQRSSSASAASHYRRLESDTQTPEAPPRAGAVADAEGEAAKPLFAATLPARTRPSVLAAAGTAAPNRSGSVSKRAQPRKGSGGTGGEARGRSHSAAARGAKASPAKHKAALQQQTPSCTTSTSATPRKLAPAQPSSAAAAAAASTAAGRKRPASTAATARAGGRPETATGAAAAAAGGGAAWRVGGTSVTAMTAAELAEYKRRRRRELYAWNEVLRDKFLQGDAV